MIWDFKPSPKCIKVLQKLDQNLDGVVSKGEFLLLNKHHKELLLPLRKLKRKIQKKTVYRRFWLQLAKRRLECFGEKEVFEIFERMNPQYLSASMEYLNFRSDVVPPEFVEMWNFIQTRKGSRGAKKELPLEVEKLKPHPMNDVKLKYRSSRRIMSGGSAMSATTTDPLDAAPYVYAPSHGLDNPNLTAANLGLGFAPLGVGAVGSPKSPTTSIQPNPHSFDGTLHSLVSAVSVGSRLTDVDNLDADADRDNTYTGIDMDNIVIDNESIASPGSHMHGPADVAAEREHREQREHLREHEENDLTELPTKPHTHKHHTQKPPVEKYKGHLQREREAREALKREAEQREADEALEDLIKNLPSNTSKPGFFNDEFLGSLKNSPSWKKNHKKWDAENVESEADQDLPQAVSSM
jgi:hypothetical protein